MLKPFLLTFIKFNIMRSSDHFRFGVSKTAKGQGTQYDFISMKSIPN